MFIRFSVFNGPADNCPVIQVDDIVAVFEQACDIGFEPCYIPCPYLIGSSDKYRDSPAVFDRLPGICAMLKRIPFAEDSVQGAAAPVVYSFLGKLCDNLLWCAIGEFRRVRGVIEGLLLVFCQSVSNVSGTAFSLVDGSLCPPVLYGFAVEFEIHTHSAFGDHFGYRLVYKSNDLLAQGLRN